MATRVIERRIARLEALLSCVCRDATAVLFVAPGAPWPAVEQCPVHGRLRRTVVQLLAGDLAL